MKYQKSCPASHSSVEKTSGVNSSSFLDSLYKVTSVQPYVFFADFFRPEIVNHFHSVRFRFERSLRVGPGEDAVLRNVRYFKAALGIILG
jgi:hypothetical protein